MDAVPTWALGFAIFFGFCALCALAGFLLETLRHRR